MIRRNIKKAPKPKTLPNPYKTLAGVCFFCLVTMAEIRIYVGHIIARKIRRAAHFVHNNYCWPLANVISSLD